ncbi:MAG: hypothetical protein C0603_07270 [Denitrovibrio sp.]|nr:MAG: hypothetical protein C0603_07270 [Denitrovibrio sp.]
MNMQRFLILVLAICTIFIVGLYIVLQGEKSAVDGYAIDLDDLLKSDRQGKSLTIYSKDKVKIYEKIYERTAPLPSDVPSELMYMVRFAGENLFTCDKPSTDEDQKLLQFHHIPKTGLNNCIVLFFAERALGKKGVDEINKLRLWKTAGDIVSRYSEEGVLRSYMENTYMQNDVWGLEAAAFSYFWKSVNFLDISKQAWLVTVLTLGHLPEDDTPSFNKRTDMLIYRLYLNGSIDYNQYSAYTNSRLKYGMHSDVDTLPEYSSLIIRELQSKGVKADRQLVVHANISVKTIYAAQFAIEKRLAKYPEGVNVAMAVVNYETGGIEALAANDRWEYRTMKMRRQIGSTFKPIVYLTAVVNGAKPNEIIHDKKYSYNLGNYVYSPSNFEDYYMGNIPMRLGLVHSLNNATIILAKMAGLRNVGQMAVDLGMKARIKPYLAMPLGIFPITPLNLAKVYSTFGTYGIKNDIGFISKIENGRGEEVYLKKKLPERVTKERETYQVLYMMKDVVRRGTARGSGLIWGTAAKTGTTNEYRDAWTVAIFPPYAVVCWVGFDDHRSMGEKGTGGGRAAPVIAEFQKIVTKKAKKIDFNVPKGVVFRRVNQKTGVVIGKGCYTKRNYLEAFLKEEVPDACDRRKIVLKFTKNNKGS